MENVVAAVIDKDQRKKKVSLNHEPDVSSLFEKDKSAIPAVYDKDVGSPLVRLMFEFFTDPQSSRAAYIWGQLTAWIAITRVLEIAFESCDGPNQYVGRELDNSRYYFFLTDNQYWKVYIACMVPLIIDSVGRLVMLGFVIFATENNALYHTLRQDGLEMFLLFADIVGVIPFMATAIYIRPYNVAANQLQNVVTTLLELMITARILRLIKNMPAIRAIRIALLNSVDHLVLPIFFFLTFNITSGVFLYFVEPCYNIDTCPWEDLFESSFFSIVTMTTTGYGNQIPQYELGRFAACCVMVFGALFLSMPLAIIGNEYEAAWSKITEEIEQKKAAEEATKVAAAAALLNHARLAHEINTSTSNIGVGAEENKQATPGNEAETANNSGATNNSVLSAHHLSPNVELLAAAEEEKKRKEYEGEKNLVVSDPVLTTQKTLFESIFILRESIVGADFISPSMMLQYCELQANLPAFLTCLRNELNYLVRERFRQVAGLESLVVKAAEEEVKVAGKRRLSMFAGGVTKHAQAQAHNTPSHDPTSSATAQLNSINNASGAGGSTGTSAAAVAAQRNKQLLAIQEQDDGDGDEGSDSGKQSTPVRSRLNSVPRSSANNNNAPFSPGPSSSNREQDRIDKSAALGTSTTAGTPAGTPTPAAVSASTASPAPEGVFMRGRMRRITPEDAGAKGTLLVINRGPDDTGATGANGLPSPAIASQESNVSNASVSDKGVEERRATRAARQTMFRVSINAVTSRNSIMKRFQKMVGTDAMEQLRARTGSEEFYHHIQVLARDPNSIRNRLWMLLEIPNSSWEAKMLQFVLIFLITFSIFILYTQTITNLTLYGESTVKCGKVINIYCDDKWDPALDPGCFAHYPNGTVSDTKLSFGCEEDHCFRHGTNFGAPDTNVTCLNTEYPSFRDITQLEDRYGKPYLFTTRYEMHHMNPVCSRIECRDNSDQYTDVQFFWVAVEFIMNITFTIELTLRIVVAESMQKFFYDTLNVFDVLSVFPFYVELFKTLLYSGFDTLNFSITASSPDPIFFVTMRSLKVFRMFKLTRHFNASKVIQETAYRAYKQILGMISFLVFLVILFAILLYQVESGTPCYVGDEHCHPPPDAIGLHVGDRIRINKDGQLTAFGNVFYGLWYSFVTLTTTGYGDIVAVTNAGQVMTIILMLMGTFYLAMPLTAAASTFYTVHELYNEKRKQETAEVEQVTGIRKPSKPDLSASTNFTPFGGASAGAAGVANGAPKTDNAALYGDFLDKKLQKRVNTLLAELFLVHNAITDFYAELHRTSTDYNDDRQLEEQGVKRQSFVEINNRKIPVLKRLRSSSTLGRDGSSGKNNNSANDGNSNNKSVLLKQMEAIILKLDNMLSNSEEDILRVVVLHHKVRKNF